MGACTYVTLIVSAMVSSYTCLHVTMKSTCYTIIYVLKFLSITTHECHCGTDILLKYIMHIAVARYIATL